jgi:hypothetical protein
MVFNIPAYTPGSQVDELYIDAWYPGNGNFSVTVISPNDITVGPVGLGGSVTGSNTADGTIRVDHGTGSNGDRNVLINIWEDTAAPRSGDWTVRVKSNSSSTREMDMWVAWNTVGAGYTPIGWTTFVEDAELIATPSSADSVISVAAYVTKTTWNRFGGGTCSYTPAPTLGSIAPFSSPGPRRDGAQKPDLAAPGMGIGATRSVNAQNPLFTDTCARTPDGYHVVSQGTSQATPHAAAVGALLLEIQPNLSVRRFKEILTETARHDSFTGSGFSTSFGHGKLDAQAAMARVPVTLLSLTASWQENRAVIRWELAETEPGARFWVERGPEAGGPFRMVSDALTGDLSFVWTDPEPLQTEPWYRVAALNRDGTLERFGPVQLAPLAGALRLWQNAPNPFASSTVIAFELQRQAEVTVDILDVAGRRVTTLHSGVLPGGYNEVVWDGRDAGGRRAAAGIYFYRLQTPHRALAGRMILTR